MLLLWAISVMRLIITYIHDYIHAYALKESIGRVEDFLPQYGPARFRDEKVNRLIICRKNHEKYHVNQTL